MLTLDVGPRVATRVPDGLDLAPITRFALRPLSPTIGAVVDGVDLAQPVDDELHAQLRAALLEWKVLFFEDQAIDRTHQRSFAQRWGELERHPFFTYVQPGQTEVDVVTLAKDAQMAGYENIWHADLTWHLQPSFGAVLHAVEVPDVGGDTLWVDAGAAYDLLPEDVQTRIEGMTAIHDWRTSFGLGMPDDVVTTLAEQFPPVEHPVVRVHPETGRRGLLVNRIFTQRIVGLDEAASDALLLELFAQFDRPEVQCRFRWQPGSVAFWDNRATLHYATNDYFPNRRTMERISITGDVPVGPGGFISRGAATA